MFGIDVIIEGRGIDVIIEGRGIDVIIEGPRPEWSNSKSVIYPG